MKTCRNSVTQSRSLAEPSVFSTLWNVCHGELIFFFKATRGPAWALWAHQLTSKDCVNWLICVSTSHDVLSSKVTLIREKAEVTVWHSRHCGMKSKSDIYRVMHNRAAWANRNTHVKLQSRINVSESVNCHPCSNCMWLLNTSQVVKSQHLIFTFRCCFIQPSVELQYKSWRSIPVRLYSLIMVWSSNCETSPRGVVNVLIT